jgi:hypothetical protein
MAEVLSAKKILTEATEAASWLEERLARLQRERK